MHNEILQSYIHQRNCDCSIYFIWYYTFSTVVWPSTTRDSSASPIRVTIAFRSSIRTAVSCAHSARGAPAMRSSKDWRVLRLCPMATYSCATARTIACRFSKENHTIWYVWCTVVRCNKCNRMQILSLVAVKERVFESRRLIPGNRNGHQQSSFTYPHTHTHTRITSVNSLISCKL